MSRPTVIIANRKMNADKKSLAEWKSALANIAVDDGLLIAALPYPYLDAGYLPQGMKLAAQDCHQATHGAFTGAVSADMLKDLQVAYVIIGHSERRQGLGENDAVVRQKAEAAQSAGLTPILCVGEDSATREGGHAQETVLKQLRACAPAGDNLIIAYEPIWAIGSGKHASPEDAQAMHAALRQEVGATCPILYGGSVTADNVADYLREDDIDGVLVGSACLDPQGFKSLIENAMPKA